MSFPGRNPASRSTKVISAIAALVASTAFGPSARDVLPQLAAVPGDGIVVATLDAGNARIRSYGRNFSGDSPFEIGSLSKTFTATLFADMVVRHEVDPNDPIQKYLPAGTKAPTFEGHAITLADLATQRSGLPRMPLSFTPTRVDDPYDYDEAKLFAFLDTYALTRAPGTAYEYSNLGFGLLGDLLARRLGVQYASAIRTRILVPLGMNHTDLEMVGHDVRTVAGHDVDGDPVANWHWAALAGAGAVVSTPNDMLRFAKANLDSAHGPLGAAMALAQRPVRAAGPRRIGFAWFTDPDGIVWHNGGTAGFRTFLGLDPAHDRAVFVAADAFLDAVDAIGQHVLDPAFLLPEKPRPDTPVERRTLDEDVGRYRFADGSTGDVTLDARGLIFTSDRPAFHARLHPASVGTFRFREYPGVSVEIGQSAGERVLIFMQPGTAPQTAKRLP